MRSMTFYFDTLPNHPKPKHLESLTSYLCRLANANGIKRISDLSRIVAPYSDVKSTRKMADYTPVDLRYLSDVTSLDEHILGCLTFLPLAQNFQRATDPQSQSRFLSGEIDDFLSWCPLCLEESGYRKLSWRFSFIDVCSKHRIALKNCCDNCGKRVPFLDLATV